MSYSGTMSYSSGDDDGETTMLSDEDCRTLPSQEFSVVLAVAPKSKSNTNNPTGLLPTTTAPEKRYAVVNWTDTSTEDEESVLDDDDDASHENSMLRDKDVSDEDESIILLEYDPVVRVHRQSRYEEVFPQSETRQQPSVSFDTAEEDPPPAAAAPPPDLPSLLNQEFEARLQETQRELKAIMDGRSQEKNLRERGLWNFSFSLERDDDDRLLDSFASSLWEDGRPIEGFCGYFWASTE